MKVIGSNRTCSVGPELFVADLHHDIAEDILVRSRNGEKDVLRRLWLPRFEKARVAIQIFPIYVDHLRSDTAITTDLGAVHCLLGEIQRNSDKIEIAFDFKNIQKILRRNKIAAILALEGSEAIKNDFSVIKLLYKLGIRAVSLTQVNNLLVTKLDELRMLIDVSHLSEPDFWMVLRSCEHPVIASHRNARTVCDHPRNLTDPQIRAIAKTGGVVGIGLNPRLVHKDNPTISRVVDHIDYVVKLVGVDYIALGTDFSRDVAGNEIKLIKNELHPQSCPPSSIADVGLLTQLPNLFRELLRRGYNLTSLYKFAAGNAMRVFRSMA